MVWEGPQIWSYVEKISNMALLQFFVSLVGLLIAQGEQVFCGSFIPVIAYDILYNFCQPEILEMSFIPWIYLPEILQLKFLLFTCDMTQTRHGNILENLQCRMLQQIAGAIISYIIYIRNNAM